MTRSSAACLALFLAACGSRTGVLSLEPRSDDRPDAFVPTVDAGRDAGTDARAPAPDADVPDPRIEPALEVSAGLFHTCAATRVGRVHCWGFNNQGQLGDGSSETRTTPVPSPGVRDAVAVTAGRAHTCARRADGTVLCWGSNLYGQLGDGGDETRQLLPVPVDGLIDVRALDAGGQHTCAVLDDGRLFCWGDNDRGQIGPATAGAYRRPVPVPLDEPVDEVAAGFAHTCVRFRSGRVGCWGQSAFEIVRPDEIAPPFQLDEVEGLPPITRLSSGDFETCGVTADGRVLCWGFDDREGSLDGVAPTAPAPVPGLDDAAAVSAGHEFACARRLDGHVVCWGNNERGQLGDGGEDETPGALVEPRDLPPARGVTCGWRHACALDEVGVVRCWGRDQEGQLGDGRGGEHRPPTVAAVFR